MTEIDIEEIKTRKEFPLWKSPIDTFKELEQNQHNIKTIQQYIIKFKHLLKNMERELSLKSGSPKNVSPLSGRTKNKSKKKKSKKKKSKRSSKKKRKSKKKYTKRRR